VTTSEFVIAFTTVADRETAVRIARTLVDESLVACVNLLPVDSIYRWEGKTNEEPELLLLMKTRASRVAELERRLLELHPYNTPEFIVVGVTHGSERYLQWLAEST
jgi:periplasmic divalent cation tolerance protein